MLTAVGQTAESSAAVSAPSETSGRGLGNTSGSVLLATGGAIGQLVTGLGFIVLARGITRSQLGAFASAYALTLFIGGLIEFGSSQAETRRLATSPNLGAFGVWWYQRTLATAMAVPITFIGLLAIWHHTLPVVAIVALAFQPFTQTFAAGGAAALRAVRNPAWPGWLTAAGNLVFLLTCTGWFGNRVGAAAVGASLSWVVTAAASARVLHLREHLARPSRWENPWRAASALGVFSVATNAQLLVAPLIALFANSSSAADFAAVSRWVQPIILLSGAFSTYMFPNFARSASFRSAAASLRSGTLLLVLCLLGIVALVVVAPFVVREVLGAQYTRSAIVLRWLAVSSFPVLVGQPLASLLQARDDATFVARASAATAIVVAIVTAVAAPSMHALAGALSLGLGSAILAALYAMRLRANLDSRNSILTEYGVSDGPAS